MKRLLAVVLMLLCSLPASGAITLDSTACASSTITNCPKKTKTTKTTGVSSIAPNVSVTTGAAGLVLVMLSAVVDSSLSYTFTVGAASFSSGSFSTASTLLASACTGTGCGTSTSSCTCSAIWYAVTSAALSASTVTANMSTSRTLNWFSYTLTVLPFSTSGGIGNSATNNGSGTSAQIAVTCTAASKVYGVAADWNTSTARTAMSGSTILNEARDTTDSTDAWGVYLTGTSSGGSTTIGTSSPSVSANLWGGAAAEVLDSGGGGGGPVNSGMFDFWGAVPSRNDPLASLNLANWRPQGVLNGRVPL